MCEYVDILLKSVTFQGHYDHSRRRVFAEVLIRIIEDLFIGSLQLFIDAVRLGIRESRRTFSDSLPEG